MVRKYRSGQEMIRLLKADEVPGEGESLQDALMGLGMAFALHNPEMRARRGKRVGGFDKYKRSAFLDAIRAGMKTSQAARFIEIHPSTVSKYLNKHPEFEAEIGQAILDANDEVEHALFIAAVVDRDVRAMETWLYNRVPERWQNKKTIHNKFEGHISEEHTLKVVTPESLRDPETRRLHTRFLARLVNQGSGETVASGIGDGSVEGQVVALIGSPSTE